LALLKKEASQQFLAAAAKQMKKGSHSQSIPLCDDRDPPSFLISDKLTGWHNVVTIWHGIENQKS